LAGVKNWLPIVAAFARRSAHRPFVIELRDGCRFLVRTPMDVWVLKEAYLDRQYERASVEIQDGWNIVDIGAGLGDFAIRAAKGRPHSTIYAYEPFPESFTLLQENLRLNPRTTRGNVKAFPYAIGSQGGSMQLQLVTPEPVQHSTATENATRDSVSVRSITLDQVFAELTMTRCDFLKMDCEGGEYDILFNANAATLGKIKHICLEHHDGVTPYSHADLIRFFEKNSFQVRRIPSPAYRHLGLLYAMNPML
jgi:FkbM family methyltransferase